MIAAAAAATSLSRVYIFRVAQSADFREISGCSALAVGMMVRARGPLTTSSGGAIIPLRATRVERR
jgi:hypothetical protein